MRLASANARSMLRMHVQHCAPRGMHACMQAGQVLAGRPERSVARWLLLLRSGQVSPPHHRQAGPRSSTDMARPPTLQEALGDVGRRPAVGGVWPNGSLGTCHVVRMAEVAVPIAARRLEAAIMPLPVGAVFGLHM